jgi:DNA ligase (NAD+)
MPSTCPACTRPLVRLPEEADYYCVNTECPAQFIRLLEHFAGRQAMDIEGLGSKLAVLLVEAGFIRSLADVYRLHERGVELVQMEGFAEKKVDNLLAGIEASKHRTLSRLLFGLGMRHVGKATAEVLVQHVDSLDALGAAGQAVLEAIDGVGPRIAVSIVDWFLVEDNVTLVEELKELGVNTERLPEEAVAVVAAGESANEVAGKTFVLTGTLPGMERSAAAARIKQAGGKVTSSVSKNTDYVVAGENPGSKYTKARELGIPILDADGLQALIEG